MRLEGLHIVSPDVWSGWTPTRFIIWVRETNLGKMPHSFQVAIVEGLSHGKAITILHRSIGVGKKDDPAKVHCVQSNEDFAHGKAFQFLQVNNRLPRVRFMD